jgi:sporulation protein YlmC with PRC-barrel domain
MAGRPSRVHIAEIVGSRVVTADGHAIGRVVEVRVTKHPPHRVTGLDLGPAAWLERLNVAAFIGGWHRRTQPRRVPWEAVDRVDRATITLKPGREVEVRPSEE